MKRQVTTVINSELCNGCGLCLTVCPSGTLTLKQGKATVTGNESLGCGHCAAICPTGAITVKANSPLNFTTFTSKETWLPHGKYDLASLAQLMRSRRSCRNFTDKKVDLRLLQDLVRFAITAPSGTNSQKWTFTLIPDRQTMIQFGDQTANFFNNLNKKAKNPALRLFSKLFMADRLGAYYREYYDSIQQGLDDWQQNGIDHLFHGATAAIIIGNKPDASCPHDDALLASQNILLAAHSLGLGSCMIGFAVHAINNYPALKQYLQILKDETIYSCIALGFPKEKYQRFTERKAPVIRTISS